MNTSNNQHAWKATGTGADEAGKFTRWVCDHCKEVAIMYNGKRPAGGVCTQGKVKP